MPLTPWGCAPGAVGVVLPLLGLTVPPTLGVGAVRADRSGADGPGRALRAAPGAPSPAQAALRARWRAGAMLP